MTPAPRVGGGRLIRDTVCAELRARILDGHLGSGTALSPMELAGHFGGSATPIREALIELLHEGLLENRANYGFTVRPLTVTEASDLYPMLWTLEVLALRTGIPGPAVLSELSKANARFRAAREPEEWVALDARWHELLTSQCRNSALLSTLSTLRRRIYRYELAYARHSGRAPESPAQHAVIVRALRADNQRAAYAELERNWRSGPEFLVPWLERSQPATQGTRPAGVRRLA